MPGDDDRYGPALQALKHASTRLRRAADDRYVRLTRCQWSARKRRPADRFTTLYRWLASMKANDAAAWQALVAAGVRLDGRSVRFKGKPVPGARLGKVLSDVLTTPAIAAFEEAEARRALTRLGDLPVTPGRWSRHLVGCGLDGSEFRLGRIRIAVGPPERIARVGDLFTEPEHLGAAAVAALRAPDLMVAAAWSLTAAGVDSRPRAKAMLSTIAVAVRRGVRDGVVPDKRAPYTVQQIAALGMAEPHAGLQRLVWPAPEPVDAARLAPRVDELLALRRSPVPPVTAWSLAHP